MKIGFVGLGIMGESMCENIIRKHDDVVYVFDVVKAKVEKLAALGGCPCASSLEVAEKADVFISMVPKSEHSRAVYTEILPALCPGAGTGENAWTFRAADRITCWTCGWKPRRR